MSALITVLVFMFCLMVFQIVAHLIWGYYPPKGHLQTYFRDIQGLQPTKKSIMEKLIKLNQGQSYYVLNARKYLLFTLPVCLGIFIFMLFFFRSFSFALITSFIGFLYPRYILASVIRKRRALLNTQLKEAMYSLVSSLRAGSSLQTSIERCLYDLESLFKNQKDAPIVLEFRKMWEGLQMGYSVEEVLIDFRDRANLEDVSDFVNSTLIAKKRGGNLTEILLNISNIISDKIEIKNEIQILTAGKQMEARVLSIMPIMIVGCLTLLSPEYMQPMYDSLVGKFLLFLGFVLIIINFFVSRKIVNIEV